MDGSLGTLTLERFNGREVFTISSATIYVLPEENGIDLNFEIETGIALETLPDTTAHTARPDAEFTVNVMQHSWTDFVGQQFEIPGGIDPENDDQATRLYYFEHEPTFDTVIHVLEQRAERYLVSIEGTCEDPNHYDVSKPRTHFQIEALFTPHVSSQTS